MKEPAPMTAEWYIQQAEKNRLYIEKNFQQWWRDAPLYATATFPVAGVTERALDAANKRIAVLEAKLARRDDPSPAKDTP